MLPNIMKDSVTDIIQEMYSKSIETISISAIFMLWSVSRSFYALTKGISAIYKKEESQWNTRVYIKCKKCYFNNPECLLYSYLCIDLLERRERRR